MVDFKRLSIEQARQLMATREVVLADIRDPQSYALGHIPGAVRLGNENLHEFILEQDQQQPVIVVCYHGVSSQGAARYLVEQGFAEVYSLDGGFTSWQQYQPDQVAQDHAGRD